MELKDSRGGGRLMSMIAEPRSTKTWLDAFQWNPGCLMTGSFYRMVYYN